MKIKKIVTVTVVGLTFAGVGILVAHAGTYGNSTVSWQWGYSTSNPVNNYAYSTFLDRVAPFTTSIQYGTKTPAVKSGYAMQQVTASMSFGVIPVTSGALFSVKSSNYTAAH